MSLELIFHGAAGTVTGSCMELRSERHRLLIDCGLYQGSRSLEALNYEQLPFDPAELDLVILTHAHLDHSGRLPLLVREGLRAPILSALPNRQLLGPLLADAANLQAADAERRNERPDRVGLPRFEPLYDFDDVERLVAQVEGLAIGKWAEPLPSISLRFWDAHHILGAASVELRIDGQALLFSGDIGPRATVIPDPPAPPGGWDHVVCEATYGNRDRTILTVEQRRELLAGEIEAALAHGGNLIIPAFALERTQVLIEDIVAGFDAGRIAPMPVFVDAPLADRVTQAYRRFQRSPRSGPSPFDHPKVRFTRSVEESKDLNRLSGAVIIAGSGMCTGGRVRHHLVRNLPRVDSTVLLVGYQARGTLGAVLAGGARAVRISGRDVPVRARVRTIDAYSGHADRSGLLRWLEKRTPVKGTVFLDHGEQPALDQLSRDAAMLAGLPRPLTPVLGERFLLEAGQPAQRIGNPRGDAASLVASEDWRNRYAAFIAGLEARLRALPSDAARRAALEAADRAIAAEPPSESVTYPRGAREAFAANEDRALEDTHAEAASP
ncbi:MBL fold metallo-hydrolase [Sphingomonas sp. MS122]|uniref:MBL fold metallo-hydrolase n=1 Tax=Sphingomonas sp. MS122 TaxID=3412683 RepID=UPI003C2E16F8